MIKFLVLIVLCFTQFVALSQVNKDFKKLERKKFKELVIENGNCTYKFDDMGRVKEMVLNPISSEKEVYVFDSLGYWIEYKKLECRGKIETIIELMTTSYDKNGIIVFHNWSSYDGDVECPISVDSSTYEVKREGTVQIASWVKSTSWCTSLVNDSETSVAYSSHSEEIEKTTFFDMGSFRIDYLKVEKWKDTSWQESFIVKTNKSEVLEIEVLKARSSEIEKSCGDCEEIEPNLYTCKCTNESGYEASKTLKLRHVDMDKDQLYQILPNSSSTKNRYSYSMHPWKLYKASKKVYGKDSVKLIRY